MFVFLSLLIVLILIVLMKTVKSNFLCSNSLKTHEKKDFGRFQTFGSKEVDPQYENLYQQGNGGPCIISNRMPNLELTKFPSNCPLIRNR